MPHSLLATPKKWLPNHRAAYTLDSTRQLPWGRIEKRSFRSRKRMKKTANRLQLLRGHFGPNKVLLNQLNLLFF